MGNIASLVADLFLFCYQRDVMISLADDTQANIIEALNSAFRYLEGLLNTDTRYFEGMVTQIYQCQTVLFHSIFITNTVVLILTMLIYRFWMATFLVSLLMVSDVSHKRASILFKKLFFPKFYH